MTADTVTLVGEGRMASAYLRVWQAKQFQVFQTSSAVGPLSGAVVMSHFSGRVSQDVLTNAEFARGALVVDLTTQSVPDAQASRRIAEAAGATYLAGGVTGGEREVGRPGFSLLLGGIGPNQALPAYLAALGCIVRFDTLEQAVTAKLLHNFVLIATNVALGTALGLADRAGVENLVDVLEAGTAGRSLRSSSAARDYVRAPCSSYSSALVAKDLQAMQQSFPELLRLPGFDLGQLAAHYAQYGSKPYTACPFLSI